MTHPDDDEAVPDVRIYASDRHLLLREIQSLSKDVAKLRGDTKHLNEVIIPKEEHFRRRKVYGLLAGLSLLMFLFTSTGLYVQGERLAQANEQVEQIQVQAARNSVKTCEVRNKAAEGNIESGKATAALLDGIRAAEEDNTTPGIDGVKMQRLKAYRDFANFLKSQPPPPPPLDCSIFLKPVKGLLDKYPSIT